VDGVFPVIQGELDRRLENPVSSQIHENVYFPEFRDDLVNGTLYLLRITNVTRNGERLVIALLVQCPHGGGRNFRGDVQAGKMCSRVRESLADG
jgi:hypothetical protein